MRDYRLPIIRHVNQEKNIEKVTKEVEKKEEIIQNKTENVINLSINDSVGLKESFG